jgi:hypothetical protein
MRNTRKILVGALAALGLAAAAAVTYADAPGAFGQLAMGPGMHGSAGTMGPGAMGFGDGQRGGFGRGTMGPQDGMHRSDGPGVMGPQQGARGNGYGPGMSGEQRKPGTGDRSGWNTPGNGRSDTRD